MAVTTYKKTQGRPARQIALVAVVGGLSWLLISSVGVFVSKQSGFGWLLICVGIIAGVGFVSVSLLNRPRWADFLISVQAEVDKVTWPSTNEVRRATVVVLGLLFSMAVVIFLFDTFWQWVFKTVGFLVI